MSEHHRVAVSKNNTSTRRIAQDKLFSRAPAVHDTQEVCPKNVLPNGKQVEIYNIIKKNARTILCVYHIM
jgi:hypothetical protein